MMYTEKHCLQSDFFTMDIFPAHTFLEKIEYFGSSKRKEKKKIECTTLGVINKYNLEVARDV